MRESKTGRRGRRAGPALTQFARIATLTSALCVAAQTPAVADDCAGVSCADVTTDYRVRVMTNVMKDMGTDCRSVRTVHLLDKSVDRIMMIYSVRCEDGAGLQQYQVTYWAGAGDIFVDKFTGSFKLPTTKKYRNDIGLEER